MTSVFTYGKFEVICHDCIYIVYFNMKEVNRFTDFNLMVRWIESKEVKANG